MKAPMELRHLRYFVAVAEEAHFTRAAHRLNVVQSALSMQIRMLEEEIGGPLFTRTSRRVELTEAGQILLTEARRTLAQADHAKALVQSSLSGEVGRVRIGFVGTAMLNGRLVQDIAAFHGDYPSAHLELRELPPQVQTEAILSGQLDVGYCSDGPTAAHPDLTVELIARWPMMVAVAQDHPLAKLKVVSAKVLVEHPVIFYSDGDQVQGATILELFRRRFNIEPRQVYDGNSSLCVLALAAAGVGVALVPAPLRGAGVPNIVYRPLEDADFSIGLVMLSRQRETAGTVRAFLAIARREITGRGRSPSISETGRRKSAP